MICWHFAHILTQYRPRLATTTCGLISPPRIFRSIAGSACARPRRGQAVTPRSGLITPSCTRAPERQRRRLARAERCAAATAAAGGRSPAWWRAIGALGETPAKPGTAAGGETRTNTAKSKCPSGASIAVASIRRTVAWGFSPRSPASMALRLDIGHSDLGLRMPFQQLVRPARRGPSQARGSSGRARQLPRRAQCARPLGDAPEVLATPARGPRCACVVVGRKIAAVEILLAIGCSSQSRAGGVRAPQGIRSMSVIDCPVAGPVMVDWS